MSALQSTTPRADQPARKRKRRTRTKTGCRECRRQHVKCNEGAILPSGRKVACRRCWETDQACFYPFPANGYPASSNGKVVKRAKGDPAPEKTVPDITWERAEDVSEWVGKGDDDDDENNINDNVLAAGPSTSPPVIPPAASMALPLSMALFAPQSELFDPAVHLPSSPARRGAKARDNMPVSPLTPLEAASPLPLPRSMAAPAWTSVRPAMLRDPMHDSAMVRHHATAAAVTAVMPTPNPAAPAAIVLRQPDPAPAPVPPIPRFMHSLIAPPKVIASYTLASLSTSDADRATVSYFELQGCNEVTCVSSHRDNWIFTQLFPRLFQSLSTSSGPSTPASSLSGSGTPTLRAWLHHSLLHLAYVHRGNVEKDALQSALFLTQAREHRDKATTALFKAKVLGAEFRSDDYL